MMTALYVFNVLFFTFITFIWSSRVGVNLLIKMMAFGAVLSNIWALVLHLGFLVKV